MYEDDERYCSICYTDLEEDDDGYILRDGSLICRYCLQKNSFLCKKCGDIFHKEEMKSWDEHEWYCSKCFETVLKQSVTGIDEGMTRKAREAMEKRLTGKKTNAKKSEVIHIEDDSNQFYDRSIDIWIDDNGRISKIGKLEQSRIYFDGIGYEDQVDIPDRPEDYEEGGVAEKLIYSHIDIFNEDENRPKHRKSILDISDMPDEESKDKTAEGKSIKAAVNKRIIEEFMRQINEKKAELDTINQQKERIRKEIKLLEEMLERIT